MLLVLPSLRSFAFVGTPSTPRDLSRVPARVSAEYLERLGPKAGCVARVSFQASVRGVPAGCSGRGGGSCAQDSDVPFDGTSATGPGAAVEFKKRPFGILRYQPGEIRPDGAEGWKEGRLGPTHRF